VVEVKLAGHNVDRQALEELAQKAGLSEDELRNLTPETLSAAYARISRFSNHVDELRKIAREEVEKARRSNKNIVFVMGHHSVAEHAVLNFDILGISRLAIEFLEAQRLCSYTEKSQRYITMEGDYVTPFEFKRVKSDFHKLVDFQNKNYFELYDVLKDYFKENKEFVERANEMVSLREQLTEQKVKDKEKAALGILDGWAKEDARYTLSMATEGQLGFTTNARNLEMLIKRGSAHPLKEVRDLINKLFKAGDYITPSLLLFHKPTEYFKNTRKEMVRYVKKELTKERNLPVLKPEILRDKNVKLISPDNDADNKLVATLIQAATNKPFSECYHNAVTLGDDKKREVVKKALENIEQWDAVPREFEMINLHYEIVMSSSCFAQFKRHRMLTLLPLAYDPEKLGFTIPPSIEDAGLEPKFRQVMNATHDVYVKFKKARIKKEALPYLLTNAHNRRITVNLNARELYHVSRLREDMHAQWDVSEKAASMSNLAIEVMPITGMLLAGKHEFEKKKREIYKK